ncbi:hypothetical protein BDFB_006827 [Asbolus verrucosus]|uniref:Uncharacterized protein n=1 Tax=Asbolus verrucosus TaxID=1661398 RepID=A0A482VI98_ASBVE|nr:hypothetical protein BDFB_006827 [Asbolus verrucosus]
MCFNSRSNSCSKSIGIRCSWICWYQTIPKSFWRWDKEKKDNIKGEGK